MLPLLLVGGFALAGAAGAITQQLKRSCSGGRRRTPVDASVNGTLHSSLDGQVVVAKQDERIVCVRQTARGGAVVSLSELLYADSEYPSRSMFLVKRTQSGAHILLPLHAPDMALAATGDYSCPLKVQRSRQRCKAQLWLRAKDPRLQGLASALDLQVTLSIVPMQPVPAAQIAAWLRKASQEGVLMRQRENVERQLAGKVDLQRQLEAQVYQLSMQVKEEQKERKQAQDGMQQASQQLQALNLALQAEQADVVKAREEAEALRSFMAQRQCGYSREQERLQQLLSTTQDLAERLQSRTLVLEQQAAVLSSSLAGKEQQVVQAAQQLSNLQVAFDCVKATAAERHQELLVWREKHAKLDLALQAIKARMRMVSDGEQRVRQLQASGVLRQADLQQLKQRLNLLSKHHDAEEPQPEDPDDPDRASRGAAAALEEASSSDAVEEVVRELQFESTFGSMEALLRGNATGTGSGKADSLAAWFGRSSKASLRSLVADSAASTSSLYTAQQAMQHGNEMLVGRRTREEDCSQALDQDVGGSDPRSPPSDAKHGASTALLPGSHGRHWVRPLIMVPSQDADADATCNLASARRGPSSGPSNPASDRGGREGTGSTPLSPRPDPCPSSGSAPTPGRSACTPSSVRSHNEEYDILSEDRDGYDPELSPNHRVPGSMLLTTLLSSGKRKPCAIEYDEDEDFGTATA